MKYIGAVFLFIALGIVVKAESPFKIKDQLKWLSWKLKYNKSYENEKVDSVHKEIWLRNRAFVEHHNQKADVKFKMGLNQFAAEEVPKRPVLHYVKPIFVNEARKQNRIPAYHPASWDWRDKGAVTPVKNQGMLGDAQAIVATECVESYHFIQSKHPKHLYRLSAGETHDCCTPPFNPLLNPQIFECIHNISGLCTETDYPKPIGQCMNSTCKAVAQVDGGKRVPAGDEDMLLEAVLKTPVFAAIDAGRPSFQLYTSGVYKDDRCNPAQIDHVVQIVGYGSTNGTDYWIIKNSWGENWGMKGYMLMARNMKNMCGIATMAIYPD